MKPLTIKQQTYLASAIALIIFIAVSIYVWQINHKLHDIEDERNLHVQSQMLLKDARYHIVQIQQFLTDASLTGNDEAVTEAEEHKQQVLKITRQLKQLESNIAGDISEVEAAIGVLYDTGVEMKTTYLSQGRDAGNEIMARPNTGFDDRSAQLAERLEALVKKVDSITYQLYADLKKYESHVEWSNLISALLQLAILASLAGIVLWRIVPAVGRLNQAILGLATGDKDLSRRLPVNREDELGEIAMSVNHFTGELDSMTAAIKQAGARLQKITPSFQQSSADATAGMEEVHQHTDMLATAVTEMASTVQEVARNTEQAADIAENTRVTTVDGEHIVAESVEIINTLAQDIDASASQIQTLVEHSEKIGNIINVIKSISDQTNLLALNAAIEAARAGDAGRGFAVVADEVRSLAKNTQDSATEIETMIAQIQQESQRVATSMQNNIDKAATTVEKAARAGDALHQIADSVNQLADVNMQIATASEQQSAVSEEINKSVLQVANIATNTLEITNKVGLASIECAFSASEVSDLIGQFKTSDFHAEHEDGKLVNWSDAFSVKIKSIDQQHRKLFDLMNEVYQLVVSGHHDQLQEPLDALVNFAKKHLHDEEEILQRVNYPEFKAHKQVHIKLLADMEKLYQQALTGDINKLFELVMFLKNWLLDHIYKVDMRYSDYLISKGVK